MSKCIDGFKHTSVYNIGSFFADGEVVPGMGSEAAVEEFGDEKVSCQRNGRNESAR